MGGKTGRVVVAWFADNMVGSLAIALVLALAAYCWGNISVVPVVQANLTHLSNEFHGYTADHQEFADGHLRSIRTSLDSVDARLKTLETNDAVKKETLRHIEASLRDIHDAVVPKGRK